MLCHHSGAVLGEQTTVAVVVTVRAGTVAAVQEADKEDLVNGKVRANDLEVASGDDDQTLPRHEL